MRTSEQQRLMRLAVGELRECVVETRDMLVASRARILRGRPLSMQARMRVARPASARAAATSSGGRPVSALGVVASGRDNRWP